MSNTRMFVCDTDMKERLRASMLNVSATISVALMNAYENDGLLVKALKRRLSMPAIKNKYNESINFSHNIRIATYITDMSERSRLTKDEVIRLSIEAYLHKL